METEFTKFINIAENFADANGEGVLGEQPLVLPPVEDFGYESTPRNALTFAHEGVDGVHYAVLKINGEVRNDSPIVQVSPMDFDKPVMVIARSFLDYLANGCGSTAEEMESLLNELDHRQLVYTLHQNFDLFRILDEAPLKELEEKFAYLIQPELTSD